MSDFVHLHDNFVMFTRMTESRHRVTEVTMVMMNAMLRPSMVKFEVNKIVNRECLDTTGVQVPVSGG